MRWFISISHWAYPQLTLVQILNHTIITGIYFILTIIMVINITTYYYLVPLPLRWRELRYATPFIFQVVYYYHCTFHKKPHGQRHRVNSVDLVGWWLCRLKSHSTRSLLEASLLSLGGWAGPPGPPVSILPDADLGGPSQCTVSWKGARLRAKPPPPCLAYLGKLLNLPGPQLLLLQ